MTSLQRKPQLFTAMAAAVFLAAVTLCGAVQAGDPVLYAPGYGDYPFDVQDDAPCVAPYTGGKRVYGLQHFKTPRKNIYEPPPVYRPTGPLPGPFWPYYGPGYFGWGPYYPYGGYYWIGL